MNKVRSVVGGEPGGSARNVTVLLALTEALKDMPSWALTALKSSPMVLGRERAKGAAAVNAFEEHLWAKDVLSWVGHGSGALRGGGVEGCRGGGQLRL